MEPAERQFVDSETGNTYQTNFTATGVERDSEDYLFRWVMEALSHYVAHFGNFESVSFTITRKQDAEIIH